MGSAHKKGPFRRYQLLLKSQDQWTLYEDGKRYGKDKILEIALKLKNEKLAEDFKIVASGLAEDELKYLKSRHGNNS